MLGDETRTNANFLYVEALVFLLPRSGVFNHYRSSDPQNFQRSDPCILHTYTWNVFAHKPTEIPSMDPWMKTLGPIWCCTESNENDETLTTNKSNRSQHNHHAMRKGGRWQFFHQQYLQFLPPGDCNESVCIWILKLLCCCSSSCSFTDWQQKALTNSQAGEMMLQTLLTWQSGL